jgi:hypothetical protein
VRVCGGGGGACPVKSRPYVTAAACSNSSGGFKFHPTVPPCCLSREVKSTALGEVQTRQITTGHTSMVEIIQTELENKEGGSAWLTRVTTFITIVCTRVRNVAFPSVLGELYFKSYRMHTANEE